MSANGMSADGLVEIRVWAPERERLTLVTEAGERAMTAEEDGWWRGEVPAETRYRVRVGDGPAVAPPRATWLPDGPHGPAVARMAGAFEWTAPDFRAPPLRGGVVYELHIGCFTPEGRFAAAVERLDHLVDLGVTHVQLMPVNTFPGRHGWGYDGVGLFAPHPAYGTLDELRGLVDACHRAGLAVLLDVVFNHLGPDGNYLGQFGPYFTDRYRTPWGDAVNLDGPGSDGVRRFFVDNALYWLETCRFDGLRLDAVHALYDQSATHLVEEIVEAVDRLAAEERRPLVVVAESDLNDPRVIRPRAHGGWGCDAQWSDDFHHALHAALLDERDGYYADFGSLAQIAAALQGGYVYAGQRSEARGRRHGRPLAANEGHRLLGYLQTHDQVGNRARGERFGHLAPDAAAQKIGAALVLTSPFVPMLFMGEAWAASSPFCYFTDHTDAGLAAAVREGRRREFAAFGWDPGDIPDPQVPESFERSKLVWAERERAPHADMLHWYRALIALRRAEPALRDERLDRVRVRFDEAARWLVVERGPFSIVVNLATEPQTIPHRAGRVALASAGEVPWAVCPPRSAWVVDARGESSE